MLTSRFTLLATLLLFWHSDSLLAFDNTHLIEDAGKGDPEAQYTLAHLHLKGKGGVDYDVQEAITLFQKSVAGGHREAAFDLAFLYLNGIKIEKDRKKALYWLTRSAEMGHATAQYFLGLAYKESGDLGKAAEWFKLAADEGYQEATGELQQICRKDPSLCRFPAK